ncbi:hypothetical protein V3C99_010516 [Haemonchus contortus]
MNIRLRARLSNIAVLSALTKTGVPRKQDEFAIAPFNALWKGRCSELHSAGKGIITSFVPEPPDFHA